MGFPAGAWGLESCARCAGFSVTEIGNRKERLRVREAGASAAGRGQRPYASFPGFLPLNPLRTPSPPLKRAGTPCTRERGLRLGLTALRGASEGWGYGGYGGLKRLARNQVTLRFLILVLLSLRDLVGRGLRWGCHPIPCLGTSPQTPSPLRAYGSIFYY